jgi:hypothetical protein
MRQVTNCSIPRQPRHVRDLCEDILDRGWGKTPQHIGGSEGGEPIQIYIKNFVLPEGDNPPMGDAEWQASDEPAVRIR